MSFAAYEGEVMRASHLATSWDGEWAAVLSDLVASARHRALPKLNGDMIGQMKSTLLVATITVPDVYGGRRKNYAGYLPTCEPLILLTAIYLVLTELMVVTFRYIENKTRVNI